ncbi:hypothetical protein [Roseobacter sp. OBYS 0001]|uniref:hypothetical protein n=1 Tax=Roseobacter sp. OBYS 0001 TaxID=882651 RepID=UPI001BBFF1AD|nr:hypothetical protein [Roseobacter sp. OBYS 0001]GIT85045.1 hypothetical protein ROBYS_00610 [Roseobacter sp. OBYS 0001]
MKRPRILVSALSMWLLPQFALAQGVGPNIDELAKELANPGAANATLNFKFEYRNFDGDLPNADDQDSFTATFQPVFPFVLPNGNNLIFRPALAYAFGQPDFNAGQGDFDAQDAVGDIAYDLLYAGTRDGWTLGAGIVGAVPTGSDVSSDNWLLGPSALAVKTEDWGVWGFFPFHNEKVGGSGPDTSITSLQYFLFYGVGNGWQIGTGPTITYDWKVDSDNAWTVPLGVQVAKTTAFGKQIVKLNAGIEKNVVAPDAFASDWKFTFTFSPVIKNPFQRNPPTPPADAATRAAVLAAIR